MRRTDVSTHPVRRETQEHTVRFRQVIYAISLVVALLLIAYSIDILLVAFAGVLLAILLSTVCGWIERKSGLSYSLALLIVLITLLSLIAGNIFLFGVSFASHIDQIGAAVDSASNAIRQSAERYQWANRLIQQTAGGGAIVTRAGAAAAGTLNVIVLLIVMMFVAVYVASDPDRYRRGLVSLFPRRYQRSANSTLAEIGEKLRLWLVGQMISMVVVGIATTVGLFLLGVPLPFTLGFLTAILNFIPNVGALLSAAVAAVLALTRGPETALYTLLLFLGIQTFEGYFLTPQIQQRAVSLPAALTITVQAVMSVLVGGLGLTLAAPLTVVGIVLVRKVHNGLEPH